jgi:hypothetical protein
MWRYKSVEELDIIHCLYFGIATKNIRKVTLQSVSVVGRLWLHYCFLEKVCQNSPEQCFWHIFVNLPLILVKLNVRTSLLHLEAM